MNRRMLNVVSSAALLFLTLSSITRTDAFPQHRNLKEATVGEAVHLDADDGETWYPVDSGGGGDERAPPEMSSKQNHLASDLLDAVRNIFLKWGYSLNEIPRPFGNGDPQIHFHSTPEFTNVLKLLVEKLPTELETAILNILRDNGVYELNVPEGSLDNLAELRKVDEIIAEIEALSHNPPSGAVAAHHQPKHQVKMPEEETDVEGKYDAAKDSTTDCETESGRCGSTAEAPTTAHTMDHPKIDIPPGKLLVERPETPAEDAAKLTADKEKIQTLIEEVEETLTGAAAEVKPLGPDDGTKMVQDMRQISNLVAEVETIAERNVRLLGESPCGPNNSPKDGPDLKQLDAMIAEMEALNAGKGKSAPVQQKDNHVDMNEIDRLIEEMETHKSGTSVGRVQDQSHVNQVDQIVAEIQKHQAQQSVPASYQDRDRDKINALDELINEIQAIKPASHSPGKGADLAAMDDLMNDIRHYESEFHAERLNGGGKRDEDLRAIDSLIDDIQNYQSGRLAVASPNTHRDGKLDEKVNAINQMINGLQVHDVDQMISEMESQKLDQSHKAKLSAMDELMAGMEQQHPYQIQIPSSGGNEHNEKLTQIDSLLAEMNNIQKNKIDTRPTAREPDLKELDATMNEIRNLQAQRQFQNPAHANSQAGDQLGQIDSILDEMKNIQSDRRNTRPKGIESDLTELDATINEARNIQAQHRIQNPPRGNTQAGDQLGQIDSLLAEMNHIQSHRRNTRPKGIESDLTELDATMNEARNIQAQRRIQNPPHANSQDKIGQIDSILADMKNIQSDRWNTRPKGIESDLTELDATMNEARNIQAQRRIQNPTHANSQDKIGQIDSILADMKNIQSDRRNTRPKGIESDLTELDATTNEARNLQAQHRIQNPSSVSSGRNNEKLEQIDSMLAEMKKIQANQMISQPKTSGPDLGELEETMSQAQNLLTQSQSQRSSHIPKHGSQAQEMQKIDDLVKDIKNVAKLHVPTNTNSQHGGRGPPESDQLQMLDNIIKEIGQIAKQEEKHVVADSNAAKMADLDVIMKQIHGLKSEAAITGGHAPQSQPRMEEINRIMSDLERESTIERDLQRAMDDVKHSYSSEVNRKRIQEVDHQLNEMREFQKIHGSAKDKAKPINDIQKVLDEMDEIKKGKGSPSANVYSPSSGQLVEGLKEDRFNAADEGYLRRLKLSKLLKLKARKALRD